MGDAIPVACLSVVAIAFLIGPSFCGAMIMEARARQMEAEARLLEARAALSQHEPSQTEGT